MHRQVRVFSVLAPAALLLAAVVSASPHWVQATPFGGQMVTVAAAPSSPQTLYAATVTGRFFRSLDGGLTWGERQSGLPEALVNDLVVDFQDRRTVFARTFTPGETSVLRTRNGGHDWKAIAPQFTFGLMLDARRPGVVYAMTIQGLYLSTDSGDTWTVRAFPTSRVFALAIDPHDSDHLLAAVSADGQETDFWRSTDQGTTWTVSATGVPAGYGPVVQRILFDPAHAGTAYAFLGPQDFRGTTLRTTDGGVTWSLLPAAVQLQDFAVLPDGMLLAAASFGVARSHDLGETWEPPLPATLTPETAPRDVLSRLVVSPGAPETLLAAGVEGIWKSTDEGESWSAVNQGIAALPVMSLAVEGPEVAALAGDAFFRSEDRGATWKKGQTAIDPTLPIVLDAIDPRDPHTIYGVGFDGQASFATKTTNGGDSWSVLPTGFQCSGDSVCDVEMPALVLDPRKPGGLFLSVWTYFHFQGFHDYLLYSPDDGETWQDRTTPHYVQSLAIDSQGDALYALNCTRLYRSENAGASWRQVGLGLPAKSLCTPSVSGRQRLAIVPRQPQTLYVGTSGQGVFRSTDGGVTFRPFNRGLQTADVTTVLVDRTGSVYAAVAKKGVWRWEESLRRWAPLNGGLPLWDFAGVLALDPEHPSVLYAGTRGHGIYRLDL